MNLANQNVDLENGAYGGVDVKLPHDSDDEVLGFIRENPPVLEAKQKTDKKITILSPDDHDNFGKYKIPGVKRSKLELDENSADRSIKRIKSKRILKNCEKNGEIQPNIMMNLMNII